GLPGSTAWPGSASPPARPRDCKARTIARRIISTPTTPGVRPGTDQGLMPRFSRRSSRQEATTMTTPSTAQKAALRYSVRRNTLRPGSAMIDPDPRGSALHADRLRRHLGHPRILQQVGVIDHGGPHRVIRRLAVQRGEQRALVARVLADLLGLGDPLRPDLLDGCD